MLSVRALNTEYRTGRGQSVRAARDIAFEVEKGKFFTLLGPSGCGKTTTLRSIAGLERPSAGEIAVNGRVVFSSSRNIFVALNKRNFGMVFQSYAIWPHMSVFENAAFPLQVRGTLSRKEIAERVGKVLEVVALEELAAREATKLSGGQQQRLALARAIVMEPELLLLDEPLSNLDAKLRERMRFELKRLQRELGVTTVYVTHDQSEALALSHSIAVMHAGRIEQIGSPREIYERPRNQFVADFVGSTNFLEARVLSRDGDFYRVSSQIGGMKVLATDPLATDEIVTISVRPEDIELSETRRDGENAWEGTVYQKVFLGESVDFVVTVGEHQLQCKTHPSLRTRVEETIYLRMDPEKCVALKRN